LEKPKPTNLMVEELLIIIQVIKLSMDISIMDIFKVEDSFILTVEIIILDNSEEIKNKEEEFINGLEKMLILMKENSKTAKETERVFFGGQMVVDIKVISKMEFNLVMVLCIAKIIKNNIKEIG
jgi:hypothetical protein